MTAGEPPIAFLSYVRADDEHEGGRISEFRKRLESEVRFQTDDNTFRIFQDRIDVAWGQDWRARITESLDTAIFLIPVITPRFFGSEPCCDELDCFLDREGRLGRRDLVLPLYYENCPTLENPAKRSENRHAQAIADHQYRDWRKLRFSSLGSSKVRQRIRGLAKELATALVRTSSLAVEPENLIRSLAVDAPGLTNKPGESDQALSPTPEHRPSTQADVPARVGEADTPAEPPEKLPEIADRPERLGLQVAAAPGDDADVARLKTDAKVALDVGAFDTADNLAKAAEVKASQYAAARALGIPVNFRDQLSIGAEGPEMMVIPAGSFRMGDISGNGDATEKAVHAVTIKRHFAIGRYSVTFDEYDLFCEATKRSKPSDEGWGRGRRPVINVSWEDANAFCKWLSEQSALVYRLPSEAEWEYAARGGTESSYWWGETFDSRLAHCNSNRTVPTDSFRPNTFGLYQMHGNVWDQDVWRRDYQDAPDDGSPQSKWPTRVETHTEYRGGVSEAHWRLLGSAVTIPRPQPQSYTSSKEVDDRSSGHEVRGGSWRDQPFWLRSSARQSELKSRDNFSTTGFRVAIDFDSPSQRETKTPADEHLRAR